MVARSEEFGERGLASAPALAVEIRSQSTAWLDEGRKRSLYEEHGVANYWLVDPAAPSVTLLRLVTGRYVVAATARGDHPVEVDQPFPITLNPAVLSRG